MPINTPQLHIVCYDISDPKRLGRIFRYLSKTAIPLQYSVFIANLKPVQIDEIACELEDLIDPGEDDLRIYPLPRRLEIVRFGQAHLPEGINLLKGDHDLTAPGTGF